MTLQRRLLVYLMLCAPLVWALAFAISFDRARGKVDELFDTELIRLVRQVHALLPADGDASRVSFGQLPDVPMEGDADGGAADVRDLAIAAWDRNGHRVIDQDVPLSYHAGRAGFFDETLDGKAWRVYYLPAPSGKWIVAAGQRSYERDEMVFDVTLSQLLPWMAVLPVLLVAMAWAVRQALAPMQGLARQVEHRSADDLTPIPAAGQPGELMPLLKAMNDLFGRVADVLARERRFTGDAAHELRTPLAALRAQWDVVRRAAPGPARAHAEERLTAGLARMDRLISQMLMLSRVESIRPESGPASEEDVQWRPIVEDAVADCLPLAERRRIEIACEWPDDDRRALPVLGNAPLLTVMLRNLLDNAVRYATQGSRVRLRFSETALVVDNDAAAIPAEHLERLGERFHRMEGQSEPGSGLGISITRRILALHGLRLTLGPRHGDTGFRAQVHFDEQAVAHAAGHEPAPPNRH